MTKYVVRGVVGCLTTALQLLVAQMIVEEVSFHINRWRAERGRPQIY